MSFVDFVKTKLFWKHLGFILLTAFGILLIVFFLLKLYTRHGQEYIMPMIEGHSIEEVQQLDSVSNFEIVVIDSIYSPGEKAGIIIKQDPPAGSKVKSGRKIYVTVTSSSGESIPMPNCTDQSVRSAVEQLTNAGLRVGKFIFKIGEFNNIVVGQRYHGSPINEGETIRRGEEVDLIVEMTQDSYTTTMPNIIGLTEPEAEKKIWEASLNVGRKTFEGKKDVAHSRVVSYSPNNSSLTKGTTISINFVNDGKSDYNSKANSFKPAKAPVETPTEELSPDVNTENTNDVNVNEEVE